MSESPLAPDDDTFNSDELSKELRRIRRRLTILMVLVAGLIGVRAYDSLDVPRSAELAFMIIPAVAISILGTWWFVTRFLRTGGKPVPEPDGDQPTGESKDENNPEDASGKESEASSEGPEPQAES